MTEKWACLISRAFYGYLFFWMKHFVEISYKLTEAFIILAKALNFGLELFFRSSDQAWGEFGIDENTRLPSILFFPLTEIKNKRKI